MTKRNFSDLLEDYFFKTNQTVTSVARTSGIPKTTIDTWLNAGVKRPRDAQQIVMIARALQISEEEANDLLLASRHPTIADFRALAEKNHDSGLLEALSFWSIVPQVGDIDAVPFLAPARLTQKIFGREFLLSRIKSELTAGHHCVLSGMPGVGKTTLAIELAYSLVEAFPDGILWANMTHIGEGNERLDEEYLLAHMYTFIRAYGRDVKEAVTIEAREVLLRDVLQHKKALIILDNVSNTTALQRLLPSDMSACVVLATTNNQNVLRGNGTHIPIDVLDYADCLELLRHRMGEFGFRVDQEIDDVSRIISLVDGHPLALELVSSSVEHMSFAEYAEELEDESTRLDYLASWDDINQSVKRVFQVSFNRLSDGDKQLFVFVGLFSSGYFTAEALSFVSQNSLSHVKRSLARLSAYSFIFRESVNNIHNKKRPSNNAFYVHNLLKTFSTYQLLQTTLHRPFLLSRLAEYYVGFAFECAAKLDYAEIDYEWENIEPLCDMMVSDGRVEVVEDLLFALTAYWFGSFGYLDLRGKSQKGDELCSWLSAQKMTQGIDRLTAVDIKTRLASFRFRLNKWDEAQTLFRDCLTELDKVDGEADHEQIILRRSYIADYLPRILLQQDSEGARDMLETSIAELQALSSEQAQQQRGHLQVSLGEILAKSFGRMSDAIQTIEDGVQLLPSQMTPSHLKSYISLSIIYSITDDRDVAAGYMEQAIVSSKELGDHRRLASSYINRSVLLQRQGLIEDALEMSDKAGKLFRQMGDLLSMADAQLNNGRMYLMLGRLNEAETVLQQAQQIVQGSGDVEREADAILNLVEVLIAREEYNAAMPLAQEAYKLCQSHELILVMPDALTYLALLNAELEDKDSGLVLIRQAVQLAQSKSQREREGIAWSIQGQILDSLGRFSDAEQAHKTAVMLLQDQEMYQYSQAQKRFKRHQLLKGAK